MYYYSIYNKNFISEIPLDFEQTHFSNSSNIIYIKTGRVSPKYKGEYFINATSYKITSNYVFVDIPFLARYLLKDSIITIEPLIENHQDLVSIYLINFVFMFMLKKSDELYLHGSAISINSKATILLGDKGAGKSTLAATLTKFDGKILCDDLIKMSKGPIIKPGISRLKLYEDSYKTISSNNNLDSLYKDNQNKYHINLNSINEKTKLDKIFIISKSDVNEIKIREVKGGDKIQLIIPHINRINMIDTDINIYKQLLEYTKTVNVYSLIRPDRFIDPHLVAEKIVNIDKGLINDKI